MKRKIAVVTGSRAEYGLLYWVMKKLQQSAKLELRLLVTGMHLSHEFGNTYRDIENDGFNIDRKIELPSLGSRSTDIAQAMGVAAIGFAQAYEELKPNLLLVLGDRYEILAAVSAAIPFNIPIAHLHGGEVTEGAIDEQIRHAITKISHIHFASTQTYAQNIMKMGEEGWRVFNVGAPGLEWILHNPYLDKNILGQEFGVDFDKSVILATFHPVTLEQEKNEEYIDNILCALNETGMQVIFTGANSDAQGLMINEKIKRAAEINPLIHYCTNLGQVIYLSCQKYCSLMLGNSSSGIIEAASFGLPVVNIGSRQKGRLQSGNIINTGYSADEIKRGIKAALSDTFRQQVRSISNIYGDGNTSDKIVNVLENIDFSKLIHKRLAYE